jgi:hypothetical protein
MEMCFDGIVATKLDLFGTHKVKTGAQKIQSRGKFIKGPLPISWLSKAAKLGGKALNLSLALFFIHGIQPDRWIVLSSAVVEPFNCGVRQTLHKTLQQLETAGLVIVTRKKGACPRVQLVLEVPTKQEVQFGQT